ncbi:MAG: thioredoxin [Flavobacteriales bacterium]|nr:thioredoxin [Flavobacteriales bacterium]
MANFNDIINSDKPVLIDFYADWCGPCKMMGPILQDVHRNVGGRAKVLKIDVDKNPQVAAKYQVQGVPTLMVFKNGKMLWRQSGVVPAVELSRILEKHF